MRWKENEVCRMQAIKVTGGRFLHGHVRIPGAKNSVLPIMAASLLCEGGVILDNVPYLSDVRCAAQILQKLGCRVLSSEHRICVQPAEHLSSEISPELMSKMRSSVFFLAPLLSRTGSAVASVPGGCNLGARPIDIHLDGLSKMGVQIEQKEQVLFLKAPHGLKGARIALRYPSVGATETLLMAACRAQGETILTGCSVEPEVVDLAHFLRKAGACIEGIGTRCLKIYGKTKLGEVHHTVCPDRITAATVLFATAACGGEVELENVCSTDMKAIMRVLTRMGCEIREQENRIHLTRYEALQAVPELLTDVHPAFPTDACPLLAAAMLRANGTTFITDTVFENRFACAQEFNKMRAACGTQASTICIEGVSRMKGTQVHAPDLRGGAALVIAGLQAQGDTIITGLEHIARGYEDIAGLFVGLDAQISYVECQKYTLFENVR